MADTDIQTQPAPPQYTPTTNETGAFQALKTGPMKAFAEPFERLYMQSQQSGLEAATAKREQEKTLASGKANAAAELYSGMQTRMSEMDKMAPPPKMNITPDTHEGLMGLATILPIAGILIGSKGMMSGVNAMNAMTGVMKGYQEGNKARIEFEKQKYDTSMKEWDANYKISRQKLADAIDMMKTNYQAGVAKAEEAAVAMGPEPAALVRQNGAAFLLGKLDEANNHVIAAQAKLNQGSVMSQDAADMRAEMVLAGDYRASQNLGTGVTGSQNRALLDEAVALKAAERGMTGADIARMRQTYMAETGAMKSLATSEAKVGAIINVMNAAIPAALEESEKLPRGAIVPVNKLIQQGQIATSDPRYYKFAVANLQLAEQWAKAMNPIGVMRESDRDMALNMLSMATSQETYKQVVQQLQKQVKRERGAMKQTREEVGGKSESSAAAAPSFEGFRVSPVQE
jgi:hypothetical protein